MAGVRVRPVAGRQAPDRHRVLRDFTTTVTTPWPEVVAAVAVASLVVLGRQGIWTDERIEELRKVAADRVRVEIVENAAHCVRRDQPDAFHAIVDPWIAEQFGATG